MTERKNVVTFKGGAITLVGSEIKAGDKAPAFTAVSGELSPVSLSDYEGKIVIVIAVPSVDTGVCDTEVRRFNKEAANLNADTVILTISKDLPFAQNRWCGAAGIDRVKCLSDYKDEDFGPNYGTLIKELHLLTRACFVIDKTGTVVHAQYVPEVTSEPDYEAVIKAAKAAAV